jgi:acyl carrier protein
MVPWQVVEVAQIPYTPNGKVDRRALPEIEEQGLSGRSYEGPRNEREAELVRIWEELLGVERIGIHDNFFELGGHSLLAMQTISRVNKLFQINISIRVLFQLRHIAGIAEYMGLLDRSSQIETTARTEIFEL